MIIQDEENKNLNKFETDYKETILLIESVIAFFLNEFIKFDSAFRKKNQIIFFLLMSSFNDILVSINIAGKGYIAQAYILLKRIIESWRLQIYLFHNESEAIKYTNNPNYKISNLNEQVDALIETHNIYEFEDSDSTKFYKDFIKSMYERACKYSHLDSDYLKIELLSDNALIIGPNYDEKLIKIFLHCLLMMFRVEIQFINYTNWIKTNAIKDEYKNLIEIQEKLVDEIFE